MGRAKDSSRSTDDSARRIVAAPRSQQTRPIRTERGESADEPPLHDRERIPPLHLRQRARPKYFGQANVPELDLSLKTSCSGQADVALSSQRTTVTSPDPLQRGYSKSTVQS